ncbi:prepilin peptidase [Nocardia bovistercoris]|uniref:Prepilin peptidase n=1 Tax=Nocardia bovistercoris TaxID=2785916 RepID=A0A931I6Y0_9NOCA|nr:A24 family peptidase [Nocardia bovistercoris]MBH0774917.1 prepilin peptidase [Nocardia bovistercoris]
MDLPSFTILTAWCAALCWFDLRHRRLPNALTGYGAAAVLGYALGTTRFTVAVAGGVVLAAAYLSVHLYAPAALGAGDVKLAAVLGAVAAMHGARVWTWSALLAPVVTAAVGVALLFARHTDRTVPHGPAMCLATLVALVTMPP